MGYFVTFEGVEGCGKTTQIRLLAERLAATGLSVITTREPGGCPIADKIRSILLDSANREMTPTTELLLYAAARAQHIDEVIRPALATGAIVLCDRFTDATVAYQSAGRGIDRPVIDRLSNLACREVRPDLTMLLDCDPVLGLARARTRIESSIGPREERFELEAVAFHNRVRNAYLEEAAREPDRIAVIDATGSVDEIATRISRLVEARLALISNAVH